MQQFILLDTTSLTEHFFENAQLFGLITPLNPSNLCHKINTHLRLDLKRDFENDWIKPRLKSKKFPNGLESPLYLFETPREDVSLTENYFPVFHDYNQNTDVDFYIYTNKIPQAIYIKQQKEINYFLLIKNGYYIDFIQDIQKHIEAIPDIVLCKKFDLDNITWKEQFIV